MRSSKCSWRIQSRVRLVGFSAPAFRGVLEFRSVQPYLAHEPPAESFAGITVLFVHPCPILRRLNASLGVQMRRQVMLLRITSSASRCEKSTRPVSCQTPACVINHELIWVYGQSRRHADRLGPARAIQKRHEPFLFTSRGPTLVEAMVSKQFGLFGHYRGVLDDAQLRIVCAAND